MNTFVNKLLSQTETQGWSRFVYTEDLVELAHTIGEPVHGRANTTLPETLCALPTSSKNSLTSRYGLNEFPLHTDGAFFPKPPRYILLRSLGLSDSSTVVCTSILDADQSLQRLLMQGLWEVKGRFGAFLTPALKDSLLRWDPHCMMAVDYLSKKAESLLEEVYSRIETNCLKWDREGVCYLIDNWRCLHGREAVASNEDRKLERILIGESNVGL